MTYTIAKYEKIGRIARWIAIAAALTFGSLYVIDEASNPTLYFVAFMLFQIAIFGLIGVSIYQWRYQKKHRIHHRE